MRYKILQLLLWLNAIMEAGLGAYLIAAPQNFCAKIGCASVTSTQTELLMAQMYGLAAFCLGLFSLALIYLVRKSIGVVIGLCVFSVFHIGMAILQLLQNPNVSAVAIHSVFGVGFLYFALLNGSASKRIRT